MRNIFLVLSMAFSLIFNGFAQSIDDINELLGKKDYRAARAGIDKYLSEPKNEKKSDGWYFKGRVYNALSYEENMNKDEALVLKSEAFEAFKKYLTLDPKEARIKIENYLSFLDIYYGFYDLGVNYFNDKNYESAYSSFKKSNEIRLFILDKKYTYPQVKINELDTGLIVNMASAAAQAKKEDEAMIYFRQITDANISGPEYQSVYEYVADYYNKKNDQANLKEILAKARKFYPNNDFWDSLEIGSVEKGGDAKTIRAKYEERIAANPNSYALLYDYSVQLYNSIYTADTKDPEEGALKEKLTMVLKDAIKNDKGIDATGLMSNHLYNQASDLSSAAAMIKGTKPQDVQKKAEVKKEAIKYMDMFIPYAESALKYYEQLGTLKAIQKASYRSIATNLSEVYNYKGDAKKAAEYDSKKNAADKQ